MAEQRPSPIVTYKGEIIAPPKRFRDDYIAGCIYLGYIRIWDPAGQVVSADAWLERQAQLEASGFDYAWLPDVG